MLGKASADFQTQPLRDTTAPVGLKPVAVAGPSQTCSLRLFFDRYFCKFFPKPYHLL